MAIKNLLIANRGEIAIRIARSAAEAGIRAHVVHSEDDAAADHVRKADASVALAGVGARAYLDAAQIVAAAKSEGCDAVHPGYGFLSERADFARACEAAEVTFVGPAPEHLALFGDKTRARELAETQRRLRELTRLCADGIEADCVALRVSTPSVRT